MKYICQKILDIYFICILIPCNYIFAPESCTFKIYILFSWGSGNIPVRFW